MAFLVVPSFSVVTCTAVVSELTFLVVLSLSDVPSCTTVVSELVVVSWVVSSDIVVILVEA